MRCRLSANIKFRQLRKKLYAATASLVIAAVLMTSTTYAWFILSTAPEVSFVNTNVSANGALEIALGKNIGRSAAGDSGQKSGVTQANRTWGNLIDLSDENYGLPEITLFPAMLNAAGGAVNTLHPFAHPVYGPDGRVEKIYANDVFTGVYKGSGFVTSAEEYGVRGIGIAGYDAPGVEDTFGPESQRQKIYDQAAKETACKMKNSFQELCKDSKNVLMDYCYYDADVISSDFNLSAFSEKVDSIASDANEELKWMFTLLAASEVTSAKNYHAMMELLKEEYPCYEEALPLLDSTIETLHIEGVEEAIGELRAFENAADQLQAVIASGQINCDDGYSRDEIRQTVGLIFDLEQTSFSLDTVVENEVTYNRTLHNFHSSVNSKIYYQATYQEGKGWLREYDYGSFVNNLHTKLNNDIGYGYQDNESRETSADTIKNTHLEKIHNSLKLGELDQAIASLYVTHWNYWNEHAEEYYLLKDEVSEQRPQKELLEKSVEEQQEEYAKISKEVEKLEQQLEKENESTVKTELQEQVVVKQEKANSIFENLSELEAELQPMLDKEAKLKSLTDEKIYTNNDIRLETIEMVMEDTIEAVRQAALWTIAYYACDGRIPDDAYQLMLKFANSSEYVHPRTAYQKLCNYGITPVESLTQMVISYEKLEKGLLFLQSEFENAELIGWSELNAELQRVFGNITHDYYFKGYCDNHGIEYGVYGYKFHNKVYSIEDTFAPTEVIKNLQKEIPPYDASECTLCDNQSKSSKCIIHSISYTGDKPWEQALGLLTSIYYEKYRFEYGSSEYTLEERQIDVSHNMDYTEGFGFQISIGVGSEENFNESGLTVRQTRFQKAQDAISNYQSQLITAAVNMNQDMVNLLMQMVAGQETASPMIIFDYLNSLQQQLEYGEEMMRQAALAMAASDYAKDDVYESIYSNYESEDAESLIQMLRQSDFDSKVLSDLDEHMDVLETQEDLLNQSSELLAKYKDPDTGVWKSEQIPADEAAAILNPVLDTDRLTLYSYVEEEQAEKQDQGEDEGKETSLPNYLHTVLYKGVGSPAVKIEGNQVTMGDEEPITVFGNVYLSMGHSLSGSLLAFAKAQVESYTAPEGSVSAENITIYENGSNRKSYLVGTTTLELCTIDTPYALTTALWTYTGNTDYISANNELTDLYGYCIDLSVRTNVEDTDLLLQTDAVNRISDGGEVNTDSAMGAGSYMEFRIKSPQYFAEQVKKYMECLRVTITDTNSGYIYGYASLDMSDVSVNGNELKAPLRLCDKDTGIMLKENEEQYLCHLMKNAEKNLTVYVYLDGAKATDEVAAAVDTQSLQGTLNLQFTTDVTLKPADLTNSIKVPTIQSEGKDI